jgi:rhodanese-related sulfurtransferase
MKGFRVTVEEVKAELDHGSDIFMIDARNTDDWNSSDVKIKDSVRIPTNQLPERLGEVPRGRTVLTY